MEGAVSEPLLPTAFHLAEQITRLGSIQKTARECNVAASAIDRRILMLEQSLGITLFERHPRGMRPTPAGEAVVQMARRWRGDLQRLTADIKQLQGVSYGHVRIAAMDSHANGFLPGAVEQLLCDHPAITLEIEICSTDRAATALLNEEVDVVIAFNLRPQREIRLIAVEDLPFGCVVAPTHPLARSGSTTLREAAAYPLAVQSRGLIIRRYLEAKHAWLFAQRQPPLTTNSLQMLKALAREGNYVVFTSELDASTEIQDGTLIFVAIPEKAAAP